MDNQSFIAGYPNKISVRISDPSKAKQKSIDKKELFISNVPYDVQYEDVKVIFDKVSLLNYVCKL